MKRRFFLKFGQDQINSPVICNLVKTTSVNMNILKADITPGKEGYLLLELDDTGEKVNEALQYLHLLNIEIQMISKKLLFKKDECIHCGACVAVCLSDALCLNKESREITFNPELCISCHLCIKACPLRLFSTDEAHFEKKAYENS